jgi:hypothetical protein
LSSLDRLGARVRRAARARRPYRSSRFLGHFFWGWTLRVGLGLVSRHEMSRVGRPRRSVGTDVGWRIRSGSGARASRGAVFYPPGPDGGGQRAKLRVAWGTRRVLRNLSPPTTPVGGHHRSAPLPEGERFWLSLPSRLGRQPELAMRSRGLAPKNRSQAP